MSSSLDDYPLSLKTMYDIAEFILRAAKAIKPEQTIKMVNELENFYKNNRNGKVLVMGAGRSGLVGRAFAMRLLHLGFNSYVLGETIVPAIGKNDIVVAISGSGRTKLILTAAEAAKEAGAKLISITSYFDSPLAKISDVVIEIPGRTKYSKNEDYFARQILGITEPLAPLGTLFEDTTQIFLDGIVAELMIRLKKTEEDLRLIHANIEL
ncbi:6-phospho-3-hexuloisomerase [Saccharolobus solfataricus]|uniref:D-arabino 3-hexulose 6-phosphate formaldehyde lyase (HpS-1) n=3 Tax=Saccharolobus solfataricus TaxID=2287 RepID=Q980X4_SACS2|nr:6-phospho-3-hexuloisomerase [Saccharolobus solfataricus]AAK40498.1 D-arabino 3-hexulose 6-phosphate formaldehyde lyase (hpS-1) [Saccharolobus solfataricus P2]AKA73481.1 6-phospho-3-hexuloisomerase [Saccharolobus solfataricus]AKA76179.1 6-phospho-3-hexuloisomerase [Saccharolobus solfataricus]AKA78871.1 6-phospho-3-hexuloisomerase [Saccharolobus solfataricus]AZF67948.1 6-phospho-3-hexuloisomerase [Saccharolobus solfataricus]